jgi:shikimate kinase
MKNIVLVGFMGAGKSAVGAALAGKLKREFIELDDLIEKREKMPIKDIFEKKGEPYFRTAEKEIVKEVSEKKGVVISAGGGAIIDEENFQNLKKNSIIVCLRASVDTILKRTNGIASRPLLNVPDSRTRIADLLKKREPYYNKADITIDTNNLSIEDVVAKIIEILPSQNNTHL